MNNSIVSQATDQMLHATRYTPHVPAIREACYVKRDEVVLVEHFPALPSSSKSAKIPTSNSKFSHLQPSAFSLQPIFSVKTIKSWDEVPFSFDNEKEEADFWLSHQMDPRLMEGALAGSDQTESTTITIRFDPRLLARLKRLARSRYLNYQSMMKQWISERLERELRD